MSEFKKCPFCAEDVKFEAIKCKHCGSNISESKNSNINVSINGSNPKKSKVGAGLLAIFLGWIGIHKFYLGENTAGVIYLLFFWTFIPAILGLLEGIYYFSFSDENWDKKYNNLKQQKNTTNSD